MDRSPEPGNADERHLLLGWLAFHRDALASKCDGLTATQLVEESAPPSDLTLAGLVRHMTEMERVYLVYALQGGDFSLIYCTDDNPDGDIVGLTTDMVASSLNRWHAERALADALLAKVNSLDDKGVGNRFSVRWNLIKVIQEYARHNGHADIIRQRIDGAVGE
jgi:uncharacterized protein DUF664